MAICYRHFHNIYRPGKYSLMGGMKSSIKGFVWYLILMEHRSFKVVSILSIFVCKMLLDKTEVTFLCTCSGPELCGVRRTDIYLSSRMRLVLATAQPPVCQCRGTNMRLWVCSVEVKWRTKGSGEDARISAKIELVTSTIFSSTPRTARPFRTLQLKISNCRTALRRYSCRI